MDIYDILYLVRRSDEMRRKRLARVQWCALSQGDRRDHWEMDTFDPYSVAGRISLGPLDGPDTLPDVVARAAVAAYPGSDYSHTAPLAIVAVDHARIAGVVTLFDLAARPEAVGPAVVADNGQRYSVLRPQ